LKDVAARKLEISIAGGMACAGGKGPNAFGHGSLRHNIP
jgi:hypothetical protein